MPAFTTRPELTGRFGMVAATHYLGAAAGMAVLESGGNAIDAAVATGFALQVVEPHLNGPGGDMALLFAPAGQGPRVLCGQGPAPAGADADGYRDRGLDQVPGSGLLAAAIPGSTVAWLTLLRDHGTFAVPEVLRYAIGYAETGYPVLPQIADTIGAVAELFAREWIGSAAQYLPQRRVPQPGEWLTNAPLATTYRRLAAAASAGISREAGCDAAIRAWSEGFVAEAIEEFCRTPAMDSSGARHAGVLTGADLAGWRPGYEAPALGSFGPYTVAKTGPWGQGPVLLQQLALLDGLGLSPSRTAARDPHDPLEDAEMVHSVVEAAKLALADRNAYYGDSASVPLDELLGPAYTAARLALIGEHASYELRPGSPGGRTPVLPSCGQAVRRSPTAGAVGEPTVPHPDSLGRTRGDTCHIDIVDRWGSMVSATPSGGWLQSSPLIPALGFPLGTRLQMASLDPGLPTTLMPGRRPRTTLSPTLVLRDGDVIIACGTPGGDQQDQWQIPFLVRHLVGGQNLQAAIDAPTFHSTHVPGSFHPHEAHPGQLVIEDRAGTALLSELRRRRHDVVAVGPWSLGRLSAVSRDPDSGVLRAGANARGMQGYAIGR